MADRQPDTLPNFLMPAVYWGESPIHPHQIGPAFTLLCPVCCFNYNHAQRPKIVHGKDAYKAGWCGRGDLILIPFAGECGHHWILAIGFHKGEQTVFTIRLPDGPLEWDDEPGQGGRT